MIKISIIGLGQMGVNHLNNLINIKNINLINIYDKIKKKELENKYNSKFSENIKYHLLYYIAQTFTQLRTN